MNNNRCVCCGRIIPEGKMVCFQCELSTSVDTTILRDILWDHNLCRAQRQHLILAINHIERG